nr:right-handed parallel beta-helix repeat-containing protein [Bacteroidota bacterium]
MKNLLTFLILLVCALQLPAQTNIGGSIDVDFTLNLAGSPYIVTTNLTVEDGATLTIDPGVEIKFNSSKYLFVYGSIVADEAIFTSSNITPGIGDWEYIQIGDNTYQGTGTFEGCTFEYGDKIFLYSGVANFTGCLVQKMYYHGFETSGQLTVFNTTINLEGHIASTNYGFGVNAFAGSIVNIDGCEFLNCNRGLHSEGTSIISNSNMQNCAYGIYCSGQTTADNLSIINCTQRGIMISGGNVEISNSTIQNCVYGCYSNGQFTATNVTISNCTQSGISIYEESVISLTDVEIFTCLWPIYYSGPGALSVSGDLNIHDNTTDAAYVAFSNLYADWELPDLNPVQPENLNEYTPYYFSSGFTVNESARLIISSNCVVKFALYQGLNIKGKLLAQANPGEYIYFTSIYDDNWGGDTNNDGTTTSPAVNNWQGINFQDESVDAECILSRCKVRFGSYNNKGGINCYNASPTIDACEITNNYFGFYLKNASNPTITNNTIGSSLMTPVALSFEASPTFSNNILSSSDNQYDAIGILGGEIITDAVLPVRTFTEVENITYVLLGIVTVPENLSLTIDPGVVIKSFDYNHYLLVDGKFIMDGTADD